MNLLLVKRNDVGGVRWGMDGGTGEV